MFIIKPWKCTSRTTSLIKRYRLKPTNTKILYRRLKNFTKSQLTEKIERYEMDKPSEKDWEKSQKGEKVDLLNFLKTLKKDRVAF